MTAGALATRALPRRGWRARAAAYVLRRPDAPAAAVVVVAWALLLALHGPLHGLVAHGGRHAHLSPAPPEPGTGPLAAVALGLPGWALMVVAMMGPGVLPAVRHVAAGSLRWRRQRAVATFLAAYAAVWVAFGAVAIAAVTWLAPRDRTAALAVAFAAGAGWQLTSVKRRAVNDCHRATPLPPKGWRATRGCLRFGWVHGSACVRSCWPLMSVMALAPSHHLVWTLALTPFVLAERLLPRPRRTARLVAAALAAAALPAAVLAL